MALNKATLKTTIKNGIAGIDIMSEDISGQIADVICDAIDTYVKSATVTVTGATVTGTCATPAGPGTIVGTASGTGTLS